MRRLLLFLLMTSPALAQDADLTRAVTICEAHRGPSRFDNMYAAPWNEVCVPLWVDFKSLYEAGRPKPRSGAATVSIADMSAIDKDTTLSPEDRRQKVEAAGLAARLVADAAGRKDPDYLWLKGKVIGEGKARAEWWNGR